MSKKNNRVVGLIVASVKRSNFNADFEGNPRSDCFNFTASGFSIKYPYRYFWKDLKYDVFYLTETNNKEEPFNPKEKYEKLFGEKLKKNDKVNVKANLLKCVDVHNFGVIFTESGNNVNIHGVVQFTEGVNIYEDAEISSNPLMVPFTNPKNEKANHTSLGRKAVLDEAHFVFGFTVYPNNYDDFIGKADGFEGYTEENYQLFKKASLSAITRYKSSSKSGCYNELALFVNFKEGSLVAPSEIQDLISYRKEGTCGIFDFTRLVQYLNKFTEDIDNVELYYDEFRCKLEGLENLKCDLIKRSIHDESELD